MSRLRIAKRHTDEEPSCAMFNASVRLIVDLDVAHTVPSPAACRSAPRRAREPPSAPRAAPIASRCAPRKKEARPTRQASSPT